MKVVCKKEVKIYHGKYDNPQNRIHIGEIYDAKIVERKNHYEINVYFSGACYIKFFYKGIRILEDSYLIDFNEHFMSFGQYRKEKLNRIKNIL